MTLTTIPKASLSGDYKNQKYSAQSFTSIRNAHFERCEFSRCNFVFAHLQDATFRSCLFHSCDFFDAVFFRVTTPNCIFTECDLDKLILRDSQVERLQTDRESFIKLEYPTKPLPTSNLTRMEDSGLKLISGVIRTTMIRLEERQIRIENAHLSNVHISGDYPSRVEISNSILEYVTLNAYSKDVIIRDSVVNRLHMQKPETLNVVNSHAIMAWLEE